MPLTSPAAPAPTAADPVSFAPARGVQQDVRTRAAPLLFALAAACAREEAPTGRIANVKIVADDAVKAAEAVMKTAEAAGGSVTRTRIWREGDVLRAMLVVQVPSEKLTPTLAAIHEMAERVEEESVVARAAGPP